MNLAFEIAPVGFAALRRHGEVSLLERLASVGAEGLGFPLFTAAQTRHVSDSPFMDRDAAARAVAQQNPSLPPPDPRARFVVAGQQAGLLGGPLYTFLKAVSAIAMARELSHAADTPVLPLFWIASEDHDVLEVNRVTVNGRRFVHGYPGDLGRGRVPQVADIPLDDARAPLLTFLREVLPETEFTPWVLDRVAEADFSSYATCFRDLMRALFADWGLRLVDPIPLRHLTAPALAALVERWPTVEEAMRRGALTLRAAGLSAPLEGPRLFEIVAGRRVPVEIEGDRVTLASGPCSRAQAADEIRHRAQDFSPGAALRPVCQDAVLPVIATLGGPAELAYLWQIEPVYAAIDLRPSLRHPRISATFLEPSVARAVEKSGLRPEQVFEVPALLGDDEPPGVTLDRGTAAAVPTVPPAPLPAPEDRSILSAIERHGRALLAEIDRLERPETPRWLRTSREGIESGIRRILEQLKNEQRAAIGLDCARLEKIRDAILPGGRLQERQVNITQFLNLHGPKFVARAIERLDPFARHHQVVVIEHAEGPERRDTA